jgi:hypothetical protein
MKAARQVRLSDTQDVQSSFASSIERLRDMRQNRTWLPIVPDSTISRRAHRVAMAKDAVRNKLVCEHTLIISKARPKPPWWANHWLWPLQCPFLMLGAMSVMALFIFLLWTLLYIEPFYQFLLRVFGP